MSEIKISLERIANPPEKVQLMYEAVSALIREQKDISSLKVADITARAGIGKGTAYEYFSSNEELIANALVYEYACKIQQMSERVARRNGFSEQCFCVMDWLNENREYNIMFSRILRYSFGEGNCGALQEHVENELQRQVTEYMCRMIDRIMMEGYVEGCFTEREPQLRRFAFLSAMVQYAFVIMTPRNKSLLQMSDKELREYIYCSMIKALS